MGGILKSTNVNPALDIAHHTDIMQNIREKDLEKTLNYLKEDLADFCAWIWPFLHKNRPSSFIIDDSACFVNQESEVQEKKATARFRLKAKPCGMPKPPLGRGGGTP